MRPDVYKVIFSSVFFLLFVFSVLTLLVSQFSNTFSQLFLILTDEGRVYDGLISFFCFCGVLLALGYVVGASYARQDVLVHRLIAMGVCIVLIFVLILRLTMLETLDSPLLGLGHQENLMDLSFWDLVRVNFSSIVISGFFYIFFLFVPLGLWGFGYQLDTKHKLGKYLDMFCPSINVCIIALFASGLQAYYDKGNAWLYLDFFLFCLAFVLLIRVFLLHKEFFGFYEYANMLFLILGVLVCLFCSNILAQAQDYYHMRLAFYVLAFLGWCGEWMYASFRH
ncbi:hypothetical protein BKH46_01220 [Helicobacter sp. 12S02634-8]|uniref:hypothetical protein n=1 Tax=Helicobacter sp. 12S02634-8 TaxID=1476199 RepID=UPI000BA66F62|nr:hypothetical protein [Helicobacter sp. 12S02634-8]PAF48554.1 hypothetical protein BKH46_01220 [Helicobacter sp. 12S02634-8]